MAELLPGTYFGKVTDCAIGKTKAGLPQVVLMFEFQDSIGNLHNKMWFGSLKEGKAREITMDALLTCGFSGEDLLAINDGPECLDTEKLVELKVENRPDQSGKVWANISWISTPGEGSNANRLDKTEATALLSGYNLKADLMDRRQKRDARYQAKAAQTPPSSPIPESEVPF